ncbi:ABC transporter ATP-binding protein [Candidatus Bathyarchaeota archaeon]|nr:ABC transporter ATP-binding protein [Candidatus Bathyarchaeota archaeon]
MAAVEAKNLVKLFGSVKALDELSFQVEEGEVYGLIGPNGAGKTTTLRILATLLIPTNGVAKIFGFDVVSQAPEVRRIVAYLAEEAGAYRNLTGYEYLSIIARIYFNSRQKAREAVDWASEASGLGDRIQDKVKTYSKGMKRRLQVVRVFMVRPRLAILDEPTAGLDVIHANYIRRLIRDYVRRHGTTVILSSHNMLEVEYICDRVALINKGRIIAEGSPKDLKAMWEASNLEEVFVKVVGVE